MEEEKKGHHFLWLKILISLILIITLCYTCTRYVGTTGINVNEYNVINSKVPSSFYGYTIAHLSDIHYGEITNKEELTNIIKKLNKSKPNIVIISGDLLDKDIQYTDKDIIDISDTLNLINSNYKYIITGDHDYKREEFKQIIDKTDFKLLDNTYEIIYNNDYEAILIGGLSTRNDKIDIEEKIMNIDKAISTNETKYNILIMHEPSLSKKINVDNYNLLLAGHTHKGQINIPGIRQLLIPEKDNEYIDTYYKIKKTDLYISSGIGTNNIKLRLFNKPSFNLYRLLYK